MMPFAVQDRGLLGSNTGGWILATKQPVAQAERVVWQDMRELGEHTYVALVGGVPRAIVYCAGRTPVWVAYVNGMTKRCECDTREDAKKTAERLLVS